MPNFWHLAHQRPNPKIWALWGILYVSYFLNMLQYSLKFESTLFTFIIIYITFLFMNGPTWSVSSSPISSLCLLISFTELYLLSLPSLFNHFFAFSPSTPHHCPPLQRNPGRSIKPRHTIWTWPTFSDRRPPTQPHEPDSLHPLQPMA